MTANPFDQACRYLLRLWAAPLLAWLLRLAPDEIDFVDWLDTRQVVWPGHPDQVCDTVAHLRDPIRGGLPWASVVEFQIAPDELMFGRGLCYLGELWQTCKPTGHEGDRFEVGLVVVNLTGKGIASRQMHLSKTRVQTILRAQEWNLWLGLDLRRGDGLCAAVARSIKGVACRGISNRQGMAESGRSTSYREGRLGRPRSPFRVTAHRSCRGDARLR